MELRRLSAALDASSSAEPRAQLADDFTEPAFLSQVASQLQADGADAWFKIPVPSCTDRETGKRRFPRVPCGTKDPLTGKPFQPCDNPGDCEPDTVDDPVTHIVNQLWPWAVVVAVLWLFTRPDKPRRARRYRD